MHVKLYVKGCTSYTLKFRVHVGDFVNFKLMYSAGILYLLTYKFEYQNHPAILLGKTHGLM